MIEAPRSHYRKSPSSSPVLRIGLLLESVLTVPAYAAHIIRDLEASNFIEIVVVVLQKGAIPAQAKFKPHFLYQWYLRLDARMKLPNDPLAPVDCRDLLRAVETVEVQRKNDDQEFPADLIPNLRSKQLSVLIQLGGGSGHDALRQAAEFGVWRLEHSDPEYYLGGPSHFWEMREGSTVSGVVLEAFTKKQSEPLLLAKALFATEQTLSVSRNRYIPYWGSTDLILQKLHELHEFGWEYLRKSAVPNATYKGTRDRHETPRNAEMVNWLAPTVLKKAAAYPFRKPTVQHWRIAMRRSAVAFFEPQADCSGFRWIEPPRGHAWADPFLFEQEGRVWAFFEDYDYSTKRGSIACAEISGEGDWSSPMLCLDNPRSHYSYPHIFRDGSEIFMIPESYDSNSVDLYRCKVFPTDWVHETVLLQGRFVDTTVWQHDGLWWLATTSADPIPGASALWLYYSHSLTGEWTFHPSNPISRDIRNNRGAGRVFRHQNGLIRPSQSGTPTYGYSITFHEITQLSVRGYAERPVKTITPEYWNEMAGVHTYNRLGHLEVIDGRIARPLKSVL